MRDGCVRKQFITGIRLRGFGTVSLGLAAAALAAAAHGQEAPARGVGDGAKPRGEWQFEAGVNARETYTDNVALTSNKQSDFVTDVSPYFAAKKDGARLKVDARYSLQNLYYLNDANRNAINHQLAAHANAELLENHFYIDAHASAQQQATSVLGATGVDNTNATGNQTSVYNLTISPYWRHRLGSYANLLARYSHAEDANTGSTVSDSSSDTVNIGVESGSRFGQFLWGANYADQKNNNKTRSDTGFTTASAHVGYAFTRHFRGNLTAGYEDNQYQSVGGTTTKGGFWDASFTWSPTRVTHFELGYGDHYYGGSWFGKFEGGSGHLKWNLDYSESVTTSAQQNSLQNQSNSLGGINLGQTVVTTNTQLLTNSVFLNKEWRAGVTYNKGRGNLGFSLHRRQQTSQESSTGTQSSNIGDLSLGIDPVTGQTINTTTQTGADLALGWKLSTLTTSTLRIGLSQSSYPEQNRTDKTENVELGLSYKFLRNVNGGVTLRHQKRNSSQANGDYTESAATASLNAHF